MSTDVKARSTSPHHSGEESERLQVLQDVAVLSGDQHHVELLQRLVDVADAVRLHEGVLLPGVHQLGEGSQETLDASPGHLHELPGHDGLPGLGAHRRGQQHLHRTGTSSPGHTTLRHTHTHTCSNLTVPAKETLRDTYSEGTLIPQGHLFRNGRRRADAELQRQVSQLGLNGRGGGSEDVNTEGV